MRERALYLFTVAIAAGLRQLSRLEPEALSLLFVTKQHEIALAERDRASRDQQYDDGRNHEGRDEPFLRAVGVQRSGAFGMAGDR